MLFFNTLVAQVPDSISIPKKQEIKMDSSRISTVVDSISKSDLPIAKTKNFIGRFFDKKDYPNPKKALYLSLLLPGSGQIYNKQYWKAPLVYGAYTGAILNIRKNRKDYKRHRDNRIALLDDDPLTINDSGLDEQSLRSFRDNALTAAETGFLILLIVHAVQAADAFVFAHLKTFDVNEDLSLQISPQVRLDPQFQWHAGVQVALTFAEKNTSSPKLF